MADTQWLSEPETGRCRSQEDEDGKIIRRYEDELPMLGGDSKYHHLYQSLQEEFSDTYPGVVQGDVAISNQISSSHPRKRERDGDQDSRQTRQSATSSGRARRRSPSVPQSSGPAELRILDPGSQHEEYYGTEEKYKSPNPWQGLPDSISRHIQQDRNISQGEVVYKDTDFDSVAAGVERMTLQDSDVSRVSRYSYAPALSNTKLRSIQWPTNPDATVTPQWSAKFDPSTSKRGGARPSIQVSSDPRSGVSEKLSPTYRIRKSDYETFFKCGRVFRTLWADPAGSSYNNASEDDHTSVQKFRVAHGEYVYSKRRRFIVVTSNGSSCQCLPITTYDGKGYKKRGINLKDHGQIYNEGDKPLIIPGIDRLPLQLKPSTKGGLLNSNSFVNYGRAYCVDKNVKVEDIGELNSDSQRILRRYYKEIHFPKDEDSSVTLQAEPTQPVFSKAEKRRQESRPGRPESSWEVSEAMEQYPEENTFGTQYSEDLKQTAQEQPAQAPKISRSSSNSSLNSLASLVFSLAQSTHSSVSSTNSDPVYLQRLVNLLLNDRGLKGLFEVAANKLPLDKFENNFRRCLHQFSEHLRIEAPVSLPKNAPRLIRRFSTNAAHSIRRTLEHTSRTPEPTKQSAQEPILIPTESPVVDDIDETEEGEADDFEPDLDEMEEEHEGEDGNLSTLEAAILASSSFSLLRENFRIFLESDQVQRAAFDCWPAGLPLSEATELRYCTFPGLRRFLESRSPMERSLGKVLTFTGTHEAAEAISCEGYLLREWPEIGQCLVRCLEHFISSDLRLAVEDTDDCISVRLFPVEDTSSQNGIIMAARASYRLHSQIAAAASWLSAVLRVSPHQNVCKSHVSVKAMCLDASTEQEFAEHPKKVIQVTLSPLERITNPLTCWHSLFPHNVIAHGFAIRPRLQGRGLEISFANLAFASRCLSFVAYEDGLIAHGLKSVIIPITELKNDDAIQWHFESKVKQPSRKIASIPQILRLHGIDDWYRELDPKQLMDRRCFLGWVEKANVVIGTPGYALEVRPSRAQACPSVKHIQRYELTAGLSILSWATIQGTYVREPVSIPNAISTSQQNDLLDIINAATDDHAIIFDHDQETGWCLPQTSVVLQMAHSMITMNHYELYDGDLVVSKNEPRFLAQPSSDGASAACIALKQSFGLKIRKQTAGPDIFVEEAFPTLLARIWHTISDIAVSLESAANKLHLVEDLTPKYILGVDLQEALKNKQSMGIRRVLVNQPWTHLTVENPVVFFCRNFRAPIVPASITCKSWSSVPPQQNLLVAMGSAVRTFLDSRNDGLAEGLHWCASSPKLIETHPKAGNASIRHIQKLQSKRKPVSNAKVRAAIQSYLQGAFIFGNGTEIKCNASTTSFSVDPTQRRCKKHSSQRITPTPTVSTSGSATSTEPAEESRSTTPRIQSNSTSDESDPDLEDLETSTNQAQPVVVPLEQSLENFSKLNLRPPESNDVPLINNDTSESSKKSAFSSMVKRMRKKHGIRSKDDKNKRPRWRP
ncbi:uncharacterized protein PAC_17079 [Phialocephala subalpina]|uniref:DUF6590 domain-containing protein n=1 Tax=Phialocephala subalpina TaxID=576137 RepID=A0A1L7XQ73_9HELO|nr:uncharacterized protein PAC_17079 [Phialocephala subalpina]